MERALKLAPKGTCPLRQPPPERAGSAREGNLAASLLYFFDPHEKKVKRKAISEKMTYTIR